MMRLLGNQSLKYLRRSIAQRQQSTYDSTDNDLIPPTTCCMSNCANCVWFTFAEEIAQKYPNASMEVIDDVLKKYIDDKSFREFLEFEIKMRSIAKK